MKRLRCGGMIVLMFVFLLVACSGPAEESGQNGEANAPEVQGTSAPGPLVPEVTAEGGSGGLEGPERAERMSRPANDSGCRMRRPARTWQSGWKTGWVSRIPM